MKSLFHRIYQVNTLLLILCSLSSIGQPQTHNCSIIEYTRLINNAEMAIIDSSYQLAISYYDSASQNIDTPFAKDRYNGAVCLALQGNFERCQTSLLYLLGKGLEWNLIKNNPAFIKFIKSEYGKRLLEINIEPTYNTAMRRVYDSIYEADQYFRKLHPRNYHDYFNDTVRKIDATNVKCMNDLIIKFGWPTEDLIGINTPGVQQYETIIIHQSNLKYQIYNYSSDILFFYRMCLIEPNKAQYLISRSDNTNICSVMDAGLVTIVYDSLNIFNDEDLTPFLYKTGFYKISNEIKMNIDQERRLFGLEPIDDFRRKALFGQKDKRFLFPGYGGQSTFTFRKKNDFEKNRKLIISL